MSDLKEIFADTVDAVHFTGDMVRLDFGTVQPPEKEGGDPTIKQSFRVIMPLQGLLSTAESMQNLINKLTDAGILQKKG